MTMRRWRRWRARARVPTALLAPALVAAASLVAAPALAAPALAVPVPAAAPALAVAPGICASAFQPALAAEMSRRIASALRDTYATVGVAADDPEEGIRCRYHQWQEFHSASVIKVITLGALLYELQGQRTLSPYEAGLAQAMITESDNDAQDALWNEIGMTALQRFLTAARMNHTVLGQDDLWGLTEVNAHDELRLLQLLITRNPVLDKASRRYALSLMADVEPDQRWGVPAGAPGDVTVYVKDGWLPDPDLWDVNSIGDFTHHDVDYSIAILTSNDPDMAYGVTTVEDIARLINQALAKGDLDVAGADPVISPQPYQHLLCMQRRYLR